MEEQATSNKTDAVHLSEKEKVIGKRSPEKNKCMLKGCSGSLTYYHGCLGYEALVCDTCGAHYTEKAIYPNWDRKRPE